MSKKLNSKCSSCGFSYVFNPETQTLYCNQCGSTKSIQNSETSVKKEYNPKSKVLKNSNASMVYECENCGAKSNINEDKVSGVCPYCGSTNLHSLAEAVEFEPDAVVPFKISKQMALAKYKQWIKTRKFVPNKLKSNAKINKMEGVYFPCWDFDFNVNSTIKGVGINTHTNVTYSSGPNGTKIAHHNTYTTRHPFSGTQFDVFKDYLIAGNNQISQSEILELGNYGIETLKVYSPEYLLGFLSSGFDIDVHKAFDVAKVNAKNEVEQTAKLKYNYDSYEYFNVSSLFNSIMWRYIYLPVWVCNFKYQNKKYRFLVNGYNGYVTGKVPRSGWKIFGAVLGVLAVVGVIGYFVYKFFI